jgi:hypothetical protein
MGILIIVSVVDAPPHGYAGDRWNRYLELSEVAAGAGVRIHRVSASGMGDRGELAWREMTLVTSE